MGYSRDAKTQHDSDPTAASDASAEYYAPLIKRASDGTESDVGANIAQQRAMLGISGAAASYFFATIADDSLVMQINSITATHTQWQLVADDSTEPTIGDGSWTDGTLGGPFNIDGNVTSGEEWQPHVWYPWINDGSSVSPVYNSDGTHGFTVTARKVTPAAIDDLVMSAGTDPVTQVIPTFTPAFLSVAYRLELWVTGSPNQLVKADIQSGQEITTSNDGTFFVRQVNLNDPTKYADSNTDALSLQAGVSISSIVHSDPAADSKTFSVTTFTVSAAYSKYIMKEAWTSSGKPASTDGDWVTGNISTPQNFSVTNFGTTEVTFFVMDANGNISAGYAITVVANETSPATRLVSWKNTTRTLKARYGEAFDLYVTSDGDTSGDTVITVTASDGDGLTPAVLGTHYQFNTLTKTIAGGTTADTAIPFQTIQSGFGEVTADLYLTLSVSSGGTVVNATVHIFIEYTYGWMDDSKTEIDKWNVPTAELATFLPQTLTASTATIDRKLINATSLLRAVYADGLTVTVTNSEIYGSNEELIHIENAPAITLRNCYLHESDNSGTWTGFGIYIRDQNGATGTVAKCMDNRFRKNSGAVHIQHGASGLGANRPWVLFNHFTQPQYDKQLFQILYGNSGAVVWGNGIYVDAADGLPTPVEDGYNFYNYGGNSTYPVEMGCNTAQGDNVGGSSGMCFLLADLVGASNIDHYWLYLNRGSSWANGGVNFSEALNSVIEHNDFFNPADEPSLSVNSIPLFGGDSSNVCRYNRHRWWRTATQLVEKAVKPGKTTPTDWSTQIAMSEWDTTGKEYFRETKVIAEQVAWGDAFFVWYASKNCPPGAFRLIYDASANTLQGQAWGDGVGAVVDLDTPEFGDCPAWHVYSANTDYWVRVVDLEKVAARATALGYTSFFDGFTKPASGVTLYKPSVTTKYHSEWSAYMGTNGYPSGTTSSTPDSNDVTAPETPPDMSTLSASDSTTISGTCSAATDSESGLDVYIWRVDGDPTTDQETSGTTSPSFTVTEGVHTMTVAARDVAGNVTDFSAELSVDTTASGYTALPRITDGTWSQNNVLSVTDQGDGTDLMLSDGVGAPCVYRSLTLTSGHDYLLRVACKRKYGTSSWVKPRVVVADEASGYQWDLSGVASGEYVAITNDYDVLTIYEYSFTAVGTNAQLSCWANSAVAGLGCYFGTITFDDVTP